MHCGDFNFYLLKIDRQLYSTFFLIYFAAMVSYHIIQPTGVTENTATVIGNIFSNNIHDVISGNILLNLSEHFSQFISVKREKIDLKSINIFQQDYSKFSTESFRVVSIQNWSYSHENVHDTFKDFSNKLKEVVP